MKRREFVKEALLGSSSAALALPGRRRDKPNLLFLWTDQQRLDTMKVYGNSRIDVPNLNRLAAESVALERCYVSQPVCTPSRSTVLTGLWPHTNGCTANNVALDAAIPCLPEILDDPDYRTGYFGKWHLGDEVYPQHGFEEWASIEDIYSSFFRPGRDRHARSSYDRFLRGAGYRPDLADDRFSRLFEARLPIEHCKPRFLESRACDFLRRHRNRPFVLYVNFLEPHPPYTGPLDDRYRPAELPLSPSFEDPPEEDEPLAYRIKRRLAHAAREEGMDLRTEAGWRRLAANYWGSITHVDRSLGGILGTLEDLGLADSTIVVFTSDHGEMLGAHRMVQKGVMYEQATCVPALLRVPAWGRRGGLAAGRFSHIDLVPTLLDLLGRPMPGRFPGRTLAPALRRGDRAAEPVHVEWNPSQRAEEDLSSLGVPVEAARRALGARTRTVIAPDGWKLCLSDQDRCQFFRLADDPWETRNLYYTGRHGAVIRRLAGEIRAWQERVGDAVRLPDAG